MSNRSNNKSFDENDDSERIDFCPRIWCREFNNEDEEIRGRRITDKLWRLCFYVCCIPICYPCYLTRSYRRRRRRRRSRRMSCTATTTNNNANKSQQEPRNLFNTSSDTMGRTMLLRHVQRQQENDDNVIEVKVILLRSPSGVKLSQCLVREDETDNFEETVIETECVKEQDKAPKLTRLQSIRNSFRPVSLNIVPKLKKRVVEEKTSSSSTNTTTTTTATDQFYDADSFVFDNNEVKNNDDVTYRRRTLFNCQNKRMKYYSCDSLYTKKCAVCKPSLNMKPLGTRIVRCDLGYKLKCSIFDEDSVANWTGLDLNQLDSGNVDVVVLVVADEKEVDNVVSSDTGLFQYFRVFWKGFYPLLLVELVGNDHDKDNKEEEEERSFNLSKITSVFGDIHHIKVKECDLFNYITWLQECVAKLYMHSRLYHCSRFYGARVNCHKDKCPGGCELSNRFRPRSKSLPLMRKKAKWKKFKKVGIPSSKTNDYQ